MPSPVPITAERINRLPKWAGLSGMDSMPVRATCIDENRTIHVVIALDDEKLNERWKQFAQKLKDNKNPASQSFDLARLRVIDGNSFEVSTNNSLEQKFIEAESRNLSEYLQQIFNNRTLRFNIVVDENAVIQEPIERPLSTPEKYQLIVSQYPLVKELKDKLKMELDY